MKYLGITLGWLLSILFLLLTVSMILTGNTEAAVLFALATALALPAIGGVITRPAVREGADGSSSDNRRPTGANATGAGRRRMILGSARVVAVILLFVSAVRAMTGTEMTSIYTSPEVRSQIIEIYDEKMNGWPVPYEDLFLDTTYGTVHVITSGSPELPPMVLLHASGVGAWSWKFNVADLTARFRIYAIDTIGDVGKSEYASLEHLVETDRDQADLYASLLEALGVESAVIVGASEGGFIASNIARFHPERVDRLVLMGPMGYAGATRSIIRITLAQLFPLKPIQDATFRWAFSDSPVLTDEFGEWFRLLMSEAGPKKVAPLPFTAEERAEIEAPTLFILGDRDNLVGDPDRVIAVAELMPDARVEVVRAGHLMGGEIPETVNPMILAFTAP